MSSLASRMTGTKIATKASDWVPVASPDELGVGDVIAIHKKVRPCKPAAGGKWSRKRYQPSGRKEVEVQIAGRVVRRFQKTEGHLRGLVSVLEPTAVSMPNGGAVPDDIRVPLHDQIWLYVRHFGSYAVRRSVSRSPDPQASENDRHAFMADLLRKACGDDVDLLALCVDPWDIPCLKLGRHAAVDMLRLETGWPRIREFHIRQCDGRMERPHPWSETWSPPVKESVPFDHTQIPDDGPAPPTRRARRIRNAEEIAAYEQHRARLIAEAEADPEVAAMLAAMPGIKVREVRLRYDPSDDLDEDQTAVEDEVAEVKPAPVRLAEPGELVDLDSHSSEPSEFVAEPAETDEQEQSEQTER